MVERQALLLHRTADAKVTSNRVTLQFAPGRMQLYSNQEHLAIKSIWHHAQCMMHLMDDANWLSHTTLQVQDMMIAALSAESHCCVHACQNSVKVKHIFACFKIHTSTCVQYKRVCVALPKRAVHVRIHLGDFKPDQLAQ